jgi:hypothetical protein
VCCPEGIGNLNRQLQHLVERKRLVGNEMLQGSAVEKLHCNELSPVLLPDVVNGADVGVIQRRSGLGFAAESFESSGVVEHFGRQEFQSHGAMEPCVLGFVDDTMPPPPSFSRMR